MSYSGSSRTHIRYANVACPTCGAGVTRPCRSRHGRNYDFNYTHADRVWMCHAKAAK